MRGHRYRRESLARHDRERTFNTAFVPETSSRTRRKRKLRRSLLGVITRKPRTSLPGWDLGGPADRTP